MIVKLKVLQDLTANTGKVTVIYVKLENPALTSQVMENLRKLGLGDYRVYSMEEVVSQFTANNVPLLKPFIAAVIGLAVVIGFLVVFLSMYTAVLERTPIMEGKMMSMIVTRAPGWEPPKKSAPVARERKGQRNGEAASEAAEAATAPAVAPPGSGVALAAAPQEIDTPAT